MSVLASCAHFAGVPCAHHAGISGTAVATNGLGVIIVIALIVLIFKGPGNKPGPK